MSKYLVSTVETYRVDSEAEVKQAIEEAKQNKSFTLTKYTSEYKERKLKGEVVDQYFKLQLTKVFNDIKEPDTYVDVNYKVEAGYFPPAIEKEDDEKEEDGGIEF